MSCKAVTTGVRTRWAGTVNNVLTLGTIATLFLVGGKWTLPSIPAPAILDAFEIDSGLWAMIDGYAFWAILVAIHHAGAANADSFPGKFSQG